MFLIGDAFLKHFYSVYDFDRDTVSLGINMHSKGKVSMFKPGTRSQQNMVQAEPKLLDPEVDDSYIQTSNSTSTFAKMSDNNNSTAHV